MSIDRRRFLQASAATAAAVGLSPASFARTAPTGEHARPAGGPIAIASGNGLEAVRRAVQRMNEGVDPMDAIVEGVGIVEADPEDTSVGYGGLPNADGVVQLDSCVMHGPTHRAGSVGALEDTIHAAQVALAVLKQTDHVMLVGEGATRFARELGFPKVDMLTPRARAAWLRWRANLNPDDDYLDADQQIHSDGEKDVPYTTGTIHCSGLAANGDNAGVTTTSGLSYKIPGRVGDSPIIGAGNYCDGVVGSAGATGRGEAVIQVCGAFMAVREMEDGRSPTEACLAVLKRIADRTKRPHLLDAKGRPNFDVVMYALRKDGAFGSASMFGDRTFAVCDEKGARLEKCAGLFER
ncbi:MAG: N(4)-(beta-N-acetylglucosaminyl)-L-asparaginase [Planctomycetota bacterium]